MSAPSVLKRVARVPGLRTSDAVLEELTTAIRSLRLAPGQSLSEVALAQELGVSRTPLRTAISFLLTQRLVDVVPQVGTRVSLINMHDVELACFIRINLELGAVRAAIEEPITEEYGLEAILERQRAAMAAHDLEAFFAADEAFHQRVFELAGYRGAWDVVNHSKIQLDRLRHLSLPVPEVLELLIDDHAALAQAIERKQLREGGEVVQRHGARAAELAPELQRTHPHYFTE